MFKEELARMRSRFDEVQEDPKLRDRLAEDLAKLIERLDLLQGLYEAHMDIGSGSALGLELAWRTDTGITYLAILPEPDGSGRARLVPFDKSRMYGHQTFATPKEALAEALRRGYFETACGMMDRFAATPAWRKSIAEAQLITRYSNSEIGSGEFHTAMRSLNDDSVGAATA